MGSMVTTCGPGSRSPLAARLQGPAAPVLPPAKLNSPPAPLACSFVILAHDAATNEQVALKVSRGFPAACTVGRLAAKGSRAGSRFIGNAGGVERARLLQNKRPCSAPTI